MSTDMPQAPMAPPAGEARFFAGVALAATLGFAVWMATLAGVADTLWIFVALQVVPLTRTNWRGFRTACFRMAGLFVPLALFGAFFGWLLLLPAAVLLLIAGCLAKPPRRVAC